MNIVYIIHGRVTAQRVAVYKVVQLFRSARKSVENGSTLHGSAIAFGIKPKVALLSYSSMILLII